MPRATGEVVAYERRNWNMTGADGAARSGTTRLAKIQESRASIIEVRIPDSLPEPREGDLVDLLVDVRVSGGKPQLIASGPYLGFETRDGAEFPPQAVDGQAVTSRSLTSV